MLTDTKWLVNERRRTKWTTEELFIKIKNNLLLPILLHPKLGVKICSEYDENIAIMMMQRGENQFNLDFVLRLNAALDDVERSADMYYSRHMCL